MSQHTLTTQVPHKFTFPGLAAGEHELAHPTLAITFRYSPGYGGRAPDMHQPGEPPEAAEVEFVSAELIDADGLGLKDDPKRVQEIAEEWLNDEGYHAAVAHAEETSGPDPDEAYESQRDDALDKMERWHDDDY